ncbi:MAG TPA: MmcQ/YjbR family DNA-binding protein [Candidatus Dormibacteraeota bacterium]|nr:MmcQ/YjbR family DNA-binding protein [Candidatus Dormibacteraeota bacterium]
MTSVRQLRRTALSLPEATEQDHHGRPSFRVRGKIFATLWDPERVNVMLDLHQIRIAVNDHPGVCREFWWGKQIRAVQLTLPLADARVVRELITAAWRLKAPRGLTRSRDQGR